MSSPSRLRRALRWISVSAAAACAGAIAAGATEAVGADSLLDAAATVGFVAMLAVPILFVLGMAARGLVAAWKPRVVVERFVEPSGGAPALAAWLLVGLAGTAIVCATLFAATWMIAKHGAFAALSVGTIDGIVAPVFAVIVAIAALPAARALAALLRRVPGDALRPRNIFIGLALAVVVATLFLWFVMVAPRLGPLSLAPLLAPAIGVAVAIAAHVVRVRFVPAIAALVAAGSIAAAFYVRYQEPMLALEIWADRPVAGLTVDKVFDLDAIRGGVVFTAFAPTSSPGAAHPDIILVTIDTVRADHTPPYGGRADMPTLESLAERGTTFMWAFSPSNVTRRSVPSMVIGLAPDRVKGRVVGWALRVDPRYVLLAERLRAAGYDTAGFMCCAGFWGAEARTGLARGLDHVEIEPNGATLSGKARTWLERQEQRPNRKPIFLWMHLLEPHNWTAMTGEPHNDAERNRFYDQSLMHADRMLTEVLMPTTTHPPIVIVSADHGEALGDHGQPFHSTDLFNSQTRVPFVVAGPGIAHAMIRETVSMIGLVPTIVELAGFVPPSGNAIDGVSVADLARGKRSPDPDGGFAYSEMVKDRSNPGGIVAVVLGGWKLIVTGDKEALYDIHTDPNENNDRVADPALAPVLAKLRARLEQQRARASQSPF